MPAQCLLCKADSLDQAICPDCQATLPYLPIQHCPICAIPTLDHQPCGACLKLAPAFDSTRSGFLYQGIMTQLIPAAKFGARWHLFGVLAELMLQHFALEARPDFLIPLPLHKARLQERGFNQAQEIGQTFAQHLGLSLNTFALQRVRDTEHQARLSEKARRKNMRRAFLALDIVKDKRVAIIDDVMTTGASMDEAARALKQAGARHVEAWVLARTPR